MLTQNVQNEGQRVVQLGTYFINASTISSTAFRFASGALADQTFLAAISIVLLFHVKTKKIGKANSDIFGSIFQSLSGS